MITELEETYKFLKSIYEKFKDTPDKVITLPDGQQVLIAFLKYYLENMENNHPNLKTKEKKSED